MSTPDAYGDTRLTAWLRVRRYAVPATMIETATARRLAGDWAGACAAAAVDTDLTPRAVARARGRDLADRVRSDLRLLAPELLRWHFPRAADGLLRPALTVSLARYEDAGYDGRATVHLVARTPPAWAAAGQRISLALWDPSRESPSPAPPLHPHPHPRPRFRLDLHRHLWDASHTQELRDRAGTWSAHESGTPTNERSGEAGWEAGWGVAIPRGRGEEANRRWGPDGSHPRENGAAGFGLGALPPNAAGLTHGWGLTCPRESGAAGDGLGGPALDGARGDGSWAHPPRDGWLPWGEGTLPLPDPGWAVGRWADEARILLAAGGSSVGAVAVRLGAGRWLLREVDAGGIRAAAPAAGHPHGLPVLPDAATWVLPDLELLRAGLLTPGELHPLVAEALVPGYRPTRPRPGPKPPGGPRFVECHGARHRIGLVDDVLVPLDHTPEEIRREELLAELTGTPMPCLQAIDAVHRRPEALDDVRARLDHGDVAGALAVVESLLGRGAVLRNGSLREALAGAARGRVAYGLFRAGLSVRGVPRTPPGTAGSVRALPHSRGGSPGSLRAAPPPRPRAGHVRGRTLRA